MEPLRVVPNLIEQIHGRLVDAIADGTLAPGERLAQEDLAARFHVSRQPVSHALQLLKRRGLVVDHGRRGLAVAPVEPGRVRDLYQLRAAIDGLAGRLAARRVADGAVSEQEMNHLQSTLAAGSKLASDARIHDWIEADVSFHSFIYALSGNPAIAETVEERWPHFKRGMGAVLVNPDLQKEIWSEHALIVDRILAGDPAGALQASADHTERAGRTVHDRLAAEVSAA